MEEVEARRLALRELAAGLETPLAFIRAMELLRQDSLLGQPLEAADRKILWAAEQGLRQVAALRFATNDQPLLPEPVDLRGVCEEVLADFAQFWRLIGAHPDHPTRRQSELVDVNRQALKLFLATLLAESLQFTTAGRLFMRRRRTQVRIGVRDFGPALPRNFVYQTGQTLPLRPQSKLAFFIVHELARLMRLPLCTTSHRDGVSFYLELPLSQQASWL